MIFLKAHPSRPSPLLALITTTLLGLACPLAAQDSDPEPLVTDRPGFTESTVSVQPGRVQLEVYDVRGRRVRVLEDEIRPAGRFTMHWDGRDDRGESLAAGVYFVRYRANDFQASQRMVLMR